MSQEHYLEALLDKFDLTHANPTVNPFPSNFKPICAMDEEFGEAKHLPYPAMAGAILYAATITRPNCEISAVADNGDRDFRFDPARLTTRVLLFS
jgi:hypothetical protein